MDGREKRREKRCIDVGDRVRIKKILEVNGKSVPPERRALVGKQGVVHFRDGVTGKCMVEFDNGGLTDFCSEEELEIVSCGNGYAR